MLCRDIHGAGPEQRGSITGLGQCGTSERFLTALNQAQGPLCPHTEPEMCGGLYPHSLRKVSPGLRARPCLYLQAQRLVYYKPL